MKLKLCIS